MQRGEKKNKRERSEKIIGVDNSVACHSNRRSIARVMVQKWGESGVYWGRDDGPKWMLKNGRKNNAEKKNEKEKETEESK
jgi:Cft2 family RNA processing exonuclease